MQAPLYLARSGRIDDGSPINTGSGYYWSSTIYNSEYARGLVFSSSGVGPEYSYSRYSGFSVRCVLRESLMRLI